MRPEEDESGRREAGGDEARADGGDAPGVTAKPGPFAEPWLLGACLCLLAAAACLLLGLYDAAFVAAALGAVAWFLNVRSRLPRPPDEPERRRRAARRGKPKIVSSFKFQVSS